MIIGLTGGSGTGKTTACEWFYKKGFTVIDGDKVAREVTGKGSRTLEEITAFFGEAYLCADGTLDRRKLGAYVFQNPKALEKLNEITHTAITQEVKRRLLGKEKAVIEGAAILECPIKDLCDKLLFVSCPKETRIARIMKRDNLTYAYAKARIEAQQDNSYYREKCDFELINDGKKDIEQQLEELNLA